MKDNIALILGYIVVVIGVILNTFRITKLDNILGNILDKLDKV